MNNRFLYSYILLFFIQSFAYAQTKKKTFYDATKLNIKEEFTLKNSKNLDGPYVLYYMNGKEKMKGSFTNNQKEGKWIYFFESGQIQHEGFYLHNKLSKNWIYYYENGNVKMKGNYLEGEKDSLWEFYSENGKLSGYGYYLNGKEIKDWKYFYEDGRVKNFIIYDQNVASYKAFYPNGELEMEGILKNNLSDSIWTYYYPNGQIKAKGFEKEGKKDGEWVYFYENGVVSAIGSYLNDLQVGHWKYFYPNAKLSSEGDLDMGVKNGRWISYFELGGMKGESVLNKGEGLYSEYFESGALKIEGYVKNDKNEGKWKYYYENGFLEGECEFVNGEGWYKGYTTSGKLKLEGKLKDGNKVGEWKIYDKDQEVAGYYKTFYDKEPEKLVAQQKDKDTILVVESPKKEVANYSSPKVKRRKVKFFNPSLNIYSSFILITNPLAVLRNALPIYIELYKEEKLGLEFGYIFRKKPLFKSFTSADTNQLNTRGNTVFAKLKFYNKRNRYGMFYSAHELRLDQYSYQAFIKEVLSIQKVSAEMKHLTYTFFLGDRYIKSTDKSGWTFDFYFGLGFGYKFNTNRFKFTEQNKNVFSGVADKGFFILPRVDFSFGYLF